MKNVFYSDCCNLVTNGDNMRFIGALKRFLHYNESGKLSLSVWGKTLMQTGKITALYVRLSYNDGINAESYSIEHQKSLFKNYAESNSLINFVFYANDGFTGTNFNRPDFQCMLSDIDKGLVSAVIVKDMSRLGRNYLMVGQYVEMKFSKHNVRFIAISDNVDSAKGISDLLSINNLMNGTAVILARKFVS